MADYFKCLDSKSRRSKTGLARTVNNNIKGFSPRRRSRLNKMKSASFTIDVDMPVPGNMAYKADSPRQSPDRGNSIKPDRQYSRDELIELMTHPLSSMKHPCLEIPQNKSLVSVRTGARLLEDRWDNRRRTDSLTDEDRSDGCLDPQKKRISDPKAERLRKDQEVVLSPQRRSFNSGCFVNLPPQNISNNRRPDSPHKGDRESSHRELATRRIGSGRIMRDPVWDFRSVDKEEMSNQSSNNHDFNFRQRDDRFERRMYERSHDKERPQQRNSRYNNDRRKSDRNEPEEPEWFSGGPTSQHDTIELHGFDGPVDEKTSTSKKQNKNNKNNLKNNRKISEKSETVAAKKVPSRKPSPEIISQLRPPTPKEEEEEKAEATNEIVDTGYQDEARAIPESNNKFDINDFLNFDSLPPLLSMPNGCAEESGNGSRFSQFFRQSSPQETQQKTDRQHSSSQEEMLNSMINDLTNTNNITIPPDGGNTYFAPISPAAPCNKENQSAKLLQMLQRGPEGAQAPRAITKQSCIKDLEVKGKLRSVEEVEAHYRQEQGVGENTNQSSRNKELERSFFRKVMGNKPLKLQVVNPTYRISPIGTGQPRSQTPQHGLNPPAPQRQPQIHPGMSHQQSQQMPIPRDFVMQLLQVQQQQRQQEALAANRLVPPGRHGSTSQYNVPPPLAPPSPELHAHMNSTQSQNDLLQCPEAQNIIRNLKRGEITIVYLIEQLKRPGLQPRHKEILTAIIKLHSVQTGQGEAQSTNEQLLHQIRLNQQSQQQLRIPSPHPNALQRVPSPRELVVHTQTILQNALLKKKLEEQKENFRKRQELQRSHSPNMAMGADGPISPANQQPHTTSPTLAFTPTSVLRKMTAEKEGEMGGKQMHHEMSHQPPKQGRAIVKGSAHFSVPPPAVPPTMDHMGIHQQYKTMQRNKPQQNAGNPHQHWMGVNRNNMQAPLTITPRGRNMGNNMMQQSQGMAQTVSQFMMNHNCQQRNNTLTTPDGQPMMRGHNYNMGYDEGSSSPVSNQLARWFSPELLAQARAGMLPNMPPISPTQNMLSVEEIERIHQDLHNGH